MPLSIERPQPHSGSQYLRILGVVSAVHLALALLLLAAPHFQLSRRLPPITIDIGAAAPELQRGLEEAVTAQAGQAGGANRTSTQKTAPSKSPAIAKTSIPALPNRSPDAARVSQPVEKPAPIATPEEPTASALPGSTTMAVPKGQAQVSQEKTVRTAEPDVQAAYKENPKPPYPKAAFRVGAEGSVEVTVEVNPDGSVSTVSLAQSSGNEWLDQSALDSVKGWRFRSARKDGVLIRTVVRVPITFKLRADR